MEERAVAAVLVAQVFVHVVQKALSGLDIVISRQILGGRGQYNTTFISTPTQIPQPGAEHDHDSAFG
jgi:hypothetical protein